ncbi:MAG: family 20 glycosylhydrolase [Clostridia bacterium]|nr:family 20 glycosylhydrolase [Clostridia bacterium]
MLLIPSVKEIKSGERMELSGCTFVFPENCDQRIVNLAKKVPSGSTVVEISYGDCTSEAYKITFGDKIKVDARGVKGAFYAIQTLRQIIKNGYCDAEEICDYPDFEVRGFYLDITRGRIPTVKTVKELIDNLAYYKANMLQLYVEHVFPFKEYDGIYQRTGYITPEELRELDAYCHENFIDFVPSLSCFGHLYELLESEKYKHLCELTNDVHKTHFWQRRMAHHTINPSDPESIELIKSLIDQYMPCFTSKYFNICCDETFDLGKGKNAGKDPAKLYTEFVKQIVEYVRSKGKTPMMWGDVIEHIDPLGDDIIFLNWGYSPNEKPDKIYNLASAKKTQFVCPGVSGWTTLCERIKESVPNISKMAKYGKEVGAKGLLNTCWGDYGHIVPIEACMYGTAFGCQKAWNEGADTEGFDGAMDLLYYGYNGGANFVKTIDKAHRVTYWYDLVCDYSNRMFKEEVMRAWNTPVAAELEEAFYELEDIIPYLQGTKWENEDAREALEIVAEGTQYMISMLFSRITGERLGVIFSDIEDWIKRYSALYLDESKEGELAEFVKVFYALANTYIKRD